MTLNLMPTPTPSPADQLSAALPELRRYAELAGEAECEAEKRGEIDAWADAHAWLEAAISRIITGAACRDLRLRIADEIADGDRSHHEP
jgi:hypothetical protein